MEKICGIYQIINKVNQKRYIGYSKNIYKRWQNHKYSLKKNIHGNEHLQLAYNKYSKYNFSYEILQECPESELCFWEDYWAITLRVHNKEFGYNTLPTDPNGKPKHHAKESILKMSLALKEKPHSNKGWKMSQEQKDYYSKLYTGQSISQETKDKISANSIYKGKKMPPELIAKHALGRTGLPSGKKGKHYYYDSQPVIQLDLNNNFIKEFNNAMEPAELYKTYYSSILYCCRKKPGFNTCKGFKWIYKIEYDERTST